MENVSAFLTNSVSFGFCVTLASFVFSTWLYKKTHFVLFSPLFVSSAVVIVILVIFRVPYEKYLQSANFLYYLMTPVTVALAIPLYRQFEALKKNALAIILGIVSGIVSNAFFVLGICILFKIEHAEYVSAKINYNTDCNCNYGTEQWNCFSDDYYGKPCRNFL